MSGGSARICVVVACALALAGCNLDQKGINPTRGTLNFPIALALSPAPDGAPSDHLFVINSNFDLRFNQGTLMAFDLDELAGTEVRAASTDERAPIGGLLADCTEDNPCAFDDVSSIEQDEVSIGSHADALAIRSTGGSDARLYIAGRAHRDLTFVDWNGETHMFECGEPERDEGAQTVPLCSDTFLMGGSDDVAVERELTLSGDPAAVLTGRLEDIGGPPSVGSYVLLGLRALGTGGDSVALYIDRDATGGETPIPELVDIETGFPPDLVTMTAQPGTGLAWTTSATTRDLGRVGVIVDPEDPTRSSLFNAGVRRLGGLDDGQDSRDIIFDPSAPEERAWVLERRPESVITLDLTRMGLNAGDLGLGTIYEVGLGPSRMALASIAGRRYLFVTCFDAKKVFVIDVDHGALVAVVGGISGPFEMAVDEARELLFVTDFSLSVVRIIDLEPLARFEPPFLLATLGPPTPIPTFAR